jgi:N-acetylmuramoyl-L-alanine amidase
VAALVLSVLTGPAPAGTIRIVFGDEGQSERVETAVREGVIYFNLADVAHAIGAARHWNTRTRKMVLSVGEHRVTVSADDMFITLDQSVCNVHHPVYIADGRFWVPPAFLTGIVGRLTNSDVAWKPGDDAAWVTHLGAAVVSVGIDEYAEGTAVVIGLNDAAEFRVESVRSGQIDVYIADAQMPDTLAIEQGTGDVSQVYFSELPSGVLARILTSGSAGSYSAALRSHPHRIEVLVRSGSREASDRTAVVPMPRLRSEHGALSGMTDLGDDDGIQTVIIDPGHGGRDVGAVGPTGLLEKDVALELANELADLLRKEGFYVFMTRSSDSFVPLDRRAEIANMALADIFVSIQCGAYHSSAAAGHQVSYYTLRDERESHVGRSSPVGLHYVKPGEPRPAAAELLWKRVQTAYSSESRMLAADISERLEAVLDVPGRGVRGQDLIVLSGCAMPAVVVEVGHITNGKEAALLADESYRWTVARAIARGITDFARD